jgi:hypothetical protein
MPSNLTSTGSLGNQQVFNDDLLMNANDLSFAASQFPEIIHALDYPRLRDKFGEYEKIANSARDRVRLLGTVTVLFATLALLALVTDPLWSHNRWTPRVGLIFEVGGLLAALIAANGMWLGPWKRRWLESRLMTERLRQWHFQLFVRRGQQLETSCTDQFAVAAFLAKRELWFDEFLKSHEGKLISQLESLTGEHSDSNTWLHDPQTTYSADSVIFDRVCEAFKILRFTHQHSYAVYKSRIFSNEPFWRFLKWPAKQQLQLLSGISAFCFICTLIISGVLIYDHAVESIGLHAAELPPEVKLWGRTGAIAIAIVGISFRTFQEGLGSEREIERYTVVNT